ncbi:MAG: condensation domain-containing protein, partial [Anaerolineales bacterium]
VGLTVEEQRAALNSIVTSLQARLDVCQGPLLTAALVDFGAGRASNLIIVIHKIAIDDVSWGILLEDLELLNHQISQGQPAQLPPKTTSYQFWAQQLADSVQSKEFQEELPFWLANAEIESAHLPVESVEGAGHAIESLTDIVSVGLSVEDTQAFLTEVSKAYRTMSTDVLLTALVEAFSDWTGRTTLQIALEDHGREAIFDHVDLSRTVGCFSAIYPVLLDVGGLTNPGDKLVAVKELLRNIPHAGIGYGLLRYMSAEEATIQKLTGLPQAEVSFHYMGSLDSILPPVSIFKLADDFSHLNWNPEKSPTYRIQITTYVLQGQLRVCWSYSRSDYQRTTIEGLAGGFLDALKSLITHCKSPEAGRYTPSDFPEADLSQQELDDLLSEINDMER